MSNTTELGKFKTHIKVTEYASGIICDKEGLIISELQEIDPDLTIESAD